MDEETLKGLGTYIAEAVPEAVRGHEVVKGELALHAAREEIVRVMEFLRGDRACSFEILVDLTAADYPDRASRFEIVYNLLSISGNRRVRVKTEAAEGEAVPSVAGVFSTAGWLEREVWDMYGVPFENHPDLRRILTDYGFDGHPLRKDFPLTGYSELRYDAELGRVVYEPVKLVQDFRRFDFLSPWEAMTDMQLPGDEKGTKPAHGWTGYKKTGTEK